MQKVFLFFLTATLTTAFACNVSYIKKEKSLRTVYFKLRAEPAECGLNYQPYLDYSRRALIGGRHAEALWAARKGLSAYLKNRGSRKLAYLYLRFIEGSSLYELNRLEEAIVSLKKVTGHPKINHWKVRDLRQRAYLRLIQTYYLKAGRRKDNNVKYLVSVFSKKYPYSTYRKLLTGWMKS